MKFQTIVKNFGITFLANRKLHHSPGDTQRRHYCQKRGKYKQFVYRLFFKMTDNVPGNLTSYGNTKHLSYN